MRPEITIKDARLQLAALYREREKEVRSHVGKRLTDDPKLKALQLAIYCLERVADMADPQI